ncbi:hydrolase [Psychroserpens ponticola]|uniref:Hydrolase n=1 Tax=Psychroserpens ponticola TaxID=2932268 RepID=A0ABY7RTB3_9FLAO|nr:hydrolase [Psychroserpens ponticola]WCO00353.1 hydrolase [Psychroserpens ponticola]
MKQRLFMYLFIFTLLLVIFQFVNSKSIIENYDKKLTNYMVANTQLKDSIRVMEDDVVSNFYTFKFDTNEDAMIYWEEQGFRISEFVPFIKDELMNLNVYETEDHPLVPYASMTGQKMLIDQIRMLNHKWIIASFTDGKYWGEMLLSYEIETIEDRKELKFKVIESSLYRPR